MSPFDDEGVGCKIRIVFLSEKLLLLQHHVLITHVSYGALSKEEKIALAKGSTMVKVAQCSGEDKILTEEMAVAYKYILGYVPNKYRVTDENLQRILSPFHFDELNIFEALKLMVDEFRQRLGEELLE